jgi:ATP phosphoribosyltransferase regulatory subunit
MSDVRVIDAVLANVPMNPIWLAQVHSALAGKDQAELDALSAHLPPAVQRDLRALPSLFGGVEVLEVAQQRLTPSVRLQAALDNLRWLAAQVQGMDVSIDLADLRGYAYYTGMRFALFARPDAAAPDSPAIPKMDLNPSKVKRPAPAPAPAPLSPIVKTQLSIFPRRILNNTAISFG